MFLRRTSEGWQIDLLSTAKWVRYNQNNDWFIGGTNHPYMFAFRNKKYVLDYDFYDDFGKFSKVSAGYDYYIALYKKKN